MAGLLGYLSGDSDQPSGLLGPNARQQMLAQSLLGYNGPDNPQFIPPEQQAGVSEQAQRFAHALATMPTVEAVKSGFTLPADVYSGRQAMPMPSDMDQQTGLRVADMAGLAMTGGLGGAASGAVPKEAVGIFGGKLAKTADHAALAQAEEMAAKGAPHSDIWTQTGWFQGADGKWRFEIPDNGAKFSGPELGQMMEEAQARAPSAPTRDTFSHQALFDAYPQLGDLPTRMLPTDNGGASFMSGAHSEIQVPRGALIDKGRAYGASPMLHELQHAVQAQEGFARGATPETAALPYWEEINKSLTALARQMDRAKGTEKAALKAEYDRLMDAKLSSSGWDFYKRTAGEVEARNVQTRRDMTPEERRARPPWETQDVPNEQQILSFRSDGPQMSLPDRAGLLGQAILGADSTSSGPIRAYHGSPHDFERFDLSKIGTGEGAQAYGSGLYFAEKPEVAAGYRDALEYKHRVNDVPLSGSPERLARNVLDLYGGDKDKAIVELKARMNSWLRTDPKYQVPDGYDHLMSAIQAIQSEKPLGGGKMYEVAIHADPERFLDWDKPLSAQPHLGAVASQVRPSSAFFKELVKQGDDAPGRALYEAMRAPGPAKALGYDKWSSSGPSEALREAGVPGIKYLDGGSRAAGDGSRNYVLFHDSPEIIQILRKYGVSSIAALPPAVQAAIALQNAPKQKPEN